MTSTYDWDQIGSDGGQAHIVIEHNVTSFVGTVGNGQIDRSGQDRSSFAEGTV